MNSSIINQFSSILFITPLFENRSGKLPVVKEKPFKLEKDIQVVFEANLPLVIGLEVVKSEFSIKNKRIDTLAFDPQSNAFIIIEYKRDKNISVVDQGFTYLSLMLENKADFIIEYNESLKRHLKRDEVDWSQTRVAFVSPSFTENQVQATNFKDIAIELWEVKQYENDILTINPIKRTSTSASIKPIAQQNKAFSQVAEEIKVYTEQDHFNNGSDAMVELYERFKNAIVNLADDIEVKPKVKVIGFFKSGKVFTDACIQKKNMKIWINLKKGTLDDPKSLARDVSTTGHWGNGDYEIAVTDDNNLEYIMSLIKQAL